MKLNLFIKMFVAASVLTYAQASAQIDMFVGSDTFVYVNSQVVTVTNGLQLNGNLYLRKGAQLVQTHSGASQNTGAGLLSVYQEGTMDNYGYNYWCSPVADGSGKFGVTMLGTPAADAIGVTPATAIHSSTYDGTTSAGTLNIEPFFIRTFSPLQGNAAYPDWFNDGAGTTILPGYGFSMKGTLGTDPTIPNGEGTANRPADPSTYQLTSPRQRYDFRGKPNDGDVVTSLSTGATAYFTLIGNPYPSAVDLNKFFLDPDNFDTNQAAYFWEQGPTTTATAADFTGGYGVYAPIEGIYDGTTFLGIYVPATFFNFNADGTYGPATGVNNLGNRDRRYAPIGQGFMVQRDPNSPAVIDNLVKMKNSFRVYKPEGAGTPEVGGLNNGSVFSKKLGETAQNQLPQIRFSTTFDNAAIGQMVQVFMPDSTEGIDKGKDIFTANNYPVQVNFLVGDNRCVISTVPFDVNRKIPLIFDNKAQANYKITVQEIVNLEQVGNVYLHDILADQYYDIKNNFYEFTLPPGMNYEQYEITFQNNKLGVDDLTEKSFEVFQDNAAKKLIVNNPLHKELVACDLYGITGRLIFGKKQLGTQLSYEFSTSELSDGIYIVRVTSQENKTIGQKIIVRH